MDSILRHLHTIKGNSRIFGLIGLSSIIHKSETSIKSEKNDDDEISRALSEIDSIKKEFDLYKKMAYDVFSISTEGRAFKEFLARLFLDAISLSSIWFAFL